MSDLRSSFAGTEPWTAAASVRESGDPMTDLPGLQALGTPSELPLPGKGHTVVAREHLAELSGRVAAWFDRRL